MYSLKLGLLCSRVAGIAKENDWDFITEVDPNNPFGELTANIKQIGASAFSFIVAVACIMIVIVCVRQVIVAKKDNKTEDNDWRISLLLIAMIVFGAVGIMVLIASVAAGF